MEFKDSSQHMVQRPEGEPIHWRLAGYGAIVKDDKLLVVIPTWSTLYELPGGGVEMEETMLEGTAREVLEETGYTISLHAPPIYTTDQFFYSKSTKTYYHCIGHVYRASLESEEQDFSCFNTGEIPEIAEIHWLPLKHLTQEHCHPLHWPAILLLKGKA